MRSRTDRVGVHASMINYRRRPRPRHVGNGRRSGPRGCPMRERARTTAPRADAGHVGDAAGVVQVLLEVRGLRPPRRRVACPPGRPSHGPRNGFTHPQHTKPYRASATDRAAPDSAPVDLARLAVIADESTHPAPTPCPQTGLRLREHVVPIVRHLAHPDPIVTRGYRIPDFDAGGIAVPPSLDEHKASCINYSHHRLGYALPSRDPVRSEIRHSVESPRTTTTGHGAWWMRYEAVDPRCMPGEVLPRPWVPITNEVAPCRTGVGPRWLSRNAMSGFTC
jgi:hypothetical protein